MSRFGKAKRRKLPSQLLGGRGYPGQGRGWPGILTGSIISKPTCRAQGEGVKEDFFLGVSRGQIPGVYLLSCWPLGVGAWSSGGGVGGGGHWPGPPGILYSSRCSRSQYLRYRVRSASPFESPCRGIERAPSVGSTGKEQCPRGQFPTYTLAEAPQGLGIAGIPGIGRRAGISGALVFQSLDDPVAVLFR